MKAAVRIAPRVIEVVDRPVPTARADQIPVRIRSVGVCGGDLLYYRDQGPVHSGSTAFVVCHEALGETPEGERVVIDPLLSCGHCASCENGKPQWCADRRDMGYGADGVAAEIITISPEQIHRVPDSVSDNNATLAHGLAAVLHALKKVDVSPGQRAFILGPGPAGLLFGLRLGSLGVEVTLAGRPSPRLRLAESLGMDAIQASRLEEFASESHELFDLVIETTGALDIQARTPSLIRSGGTLLLYAPGVFPLDVNLVFRQELHIFGSTGAPDTIPDALHLLGEGRFDVAPLITDVYPLNRIDDAFERAVAPPSQRGDFVKALVNVAK